MKNLLNKRSVTWFIGGAVACAALMSGRAAKSDDTATGGGTTSIYGAQIPPDQVEFLSDKDRIISVARSGAPTAIWEALEHGERVECLDCIPAVAPLLYDTSPVTREISAWWLRRRIFGVFGAGQVYEQTLNTLKSDPSAQKRAYAAQALGEFLAEPGIAACAQAIATDQDPGVRAAAAAALGRLNDAGNGALSKALADSDSTVRVAALKSAGRINVFDDSAGLVRLTSDAGPTVRRRAIEVIAAHRVTDAVGPLTSLAENDPDPGVRGAACHALGRLGDSSARATVERVSTNDSDGLVRDLALIALRQL